MNEKVDTSQEAEIEKFAEQTMAVDDADALETHIARLDDIQWDATQFLTAAPSEDQIHGIIAVARNTEFALRVMQRRLRKHAADRDALRKQNEALAAESARWSARCGMVMGERDAALHALRKIAKRIPKEPSHSREAMVIIAGTALDKIGEVFTYCQNCGGAHPRDPVLPTCGAALASTASAKWGDPTDAQIFRELSDSIASLICITPSGKMLVDNALLANWSERLSSLADRLSRPCAEAERVDRLADRLCKVARAAALSGDGDSASEDMDCVEALLAYASVLRAKEEGRG